MKKNLFLAALVMSFFSAAAQSSSKFTGTWQGVLNVGIELRIVFHIKEDGKGGFETTADSPDQSAFGMKCEKTEVKENEVVINMTSLNASYTGKLQNDSTIDGTFTQGADLPLQLKKTEKIEERKRPQTPQPPFPYKSEEVEYDNSNKTVHLAGTFTYPETEGPFTTVLLISGSGPQDRDETLMEHKPFAVLADYLTRKGYAVLRVDDRDVGKSRSTGNKEIVTSADFADDALTSIRFLLTRTVVNKKRIGVIGHSEGGFIAPILYSKWKALAFIISLAGTGVSGAEILLRQQTDPLKGKVSDSAFVSFSTLTKNTLDLIKKNYSAPNKEILIKTAVLFGNWKAEQSASVLKELNATTVSPEKYASEQVEGELIPWIKYFIATDPALFWQKVKCPVLALNGEKDIQVYARQNLDAISAALKKARNKKTTLLTLPGLNHLFQSCKKCSLNEYGELEETISPAALDAISSWLEKNVR